MSSKQPILPYVYKLTHKETNQFYIGFRKANAHRAEEDLGTRYFSSSKSVKELGFENFNTEILAEFFNAADALYFENRLIEDNFKNPLCLNKHFITEGNEHLWHCNKGRRHSEQAKLNMSLAQIGKKHKPETKRKISLSSKNKTPEYRKKMSDVLKGKERSELHKQNLSMSLSGKPFTETHRKSMSDAKMGKPLPQSSKDKISKHWLIEFEDGKEQITILNLNQWCKDNNLSYKRIKYTTFSKRYYEGVKITLIA